VKISTQIALSYFLIVGLASYFFLSVFVHDIKPGVTQSVEETLVDTSNILAELAAPDLSSGHIGDGPFSQAVKAYTQRSVDAPIWGLHKTTLDYRVYITDARGIVVYDSANRDLGQDFSRWNDVYLALRGKYGARSTATDPKDRDSAVMHVAAPILDHDRIIGVLTVAKPDSTIAPFINRAEATVRAQGIVLLLSAAAIGVFFAWRLTRSIERLRRYARDVSGGSRQPLPPTMNREIAELGQALEGMRDKLDGKLYVEQYIHALTHELKSPVAAIRGAAEFLSDDVPAADRERFAASIREQAERIRIIAERLLELARVEQLHFVESPQPIELPSLIQDVLSELGAGIELQKLRIRVLGEAGATHGDPFLVRQAIRNLLENAIDFSPEGREILVFFAETHEFVEIQVVDEGVGIPDYAIDRVFDRFYSLARPHSGRKSTGLGLPFVKEVAKLHGGTVSLANRESGGTVALFRLRRT